MRIHPCTCDGAPRRLYVFTRWGTLIAGAKSQGYDRKARRFNDKWRWITFRPNDD